MTLISPTQILRDHLSLDSEEGGQKKRSISVFVVGIVMAVGVGVAVGLLNISTDANEAFLTATSILTGLIFTMTMYFWQRSIDARSDADLLFDAPRRNLLDTMRTMLLWTTLVGIVSTGWFASLLIVFGTDKSPGWSTGISAGLLAYQLFYVVRSLLALYSASYTLRK